MESDLRLLSRYHRYGDGEAFQALVSAHAGMVHATAERVTRDAVLAQDVAQETFLALARNSGAAIRSVGAWLHHVAWQKAQNMVRSEARRQNYESLAAADLIQSSKEKSWAEIEPFLDESLADLHETARSILIERYLEGRSQHELAARMGVSQSTVSRQLNEAVHQLRQRLKKKGVMGVGSLALILGTDPIHAAPAALTASLNKIAISGVGVHAVLGSGAIVATTVFTMTATTKALLVTGTLAAVSLPFLLQRNEVKPIPVGPPRITKASIPNLISESSVSQLSDKEIFDLLFGPSTERLNHARSLVDEYTAKRPGKTKRELALDPMLSGKMMNLMQRMSQNPDEFKGLAEAVKFAVQAKGLKAGPQSGVNLNLNDIINSESQAERYLGAVLSDDPHALSDLFIDIVNEAAVEMALNPSNDKASNGVSIREGPLPASAKVIQQEPED
jgi:RNA polymerase sigma-70 factor (ECF subfamily)